MRKQLLIILLLGILLALAVSLGYWWWTPRLLSVSPAAQSANVPAGAEVRLDFSRLMQTGSLESRLSFEPAMPGAYSWQGYTLVFKPAQPWPAGVTVQARLQPGARASGILSLPLTRGLDWSFTIRQPSIIYLYPASDPASLTIQNPVSGAVRSLVSLASAVVDFDLSADGSQLYYSVRQENGTKIYRLSLLDQQPTPVTPGVATPIAGQPGSGEQTPELVLDCADALCEALAFSPQGDYLAYERGLLPGSGQFESFQVWVLPLGSAGPSRAYLAGADDHQTISPAWSSAGMLAFYDSTAKAYIFLQPGAGERGRFPNQTGQGGVWRPGGEQFLAPEIVFVDTGSSSASGLEPRADSHLMLYDLENQTTQDLTPGEGIEDTSPVFSPDGKFLAFARKYLDAQRWTPGRQLWLAQVDTRLARPLTSEPLYNHYQFVWSLSGEQLAYLRFNQGALTEPPEIWVMDLLSGSQSRLVVDGYSPRWTP